MPADTDGTDLLSTPVHFWDCGWGAAFIGEPADAMLARVARELGELQPWMIDSLLAGHAVGLVELADYRRDLETNADRPACDESEIPF